jgi:hypothetical protein
MFYNYGTCVVVGSRNTKQAVPLLPSSRTSGRERLVYGEKASRRSGKRGCRPPAHRVVL